MSSEDNMFAEGQESNSLYSTEFAPVQKPTKSAKKDIPTILSIDERISKIENQLINEIAIVSPIRLQAGEHFVSELKNFRYERPRKSVFGVDESKIQHDRHLLIATLSDLFEKFRYEKKNLFYIVLSGNQQKGALHFSHQQISNKKTQSQLLISLRCSFMTEIKKEDIEIEELEKTSAEKQRFLIRNKYICIFWGFFVNYLIYNDSPFEIISNYQFNNSIHTLPREIFNGNQHRQEFQHIAEVKKDLFGKEQRILYVLKMEGLWLKSNIESLLEKLRKLTDRKCDLLFETLSISDTLKLEKKVSKNFSKV